MYRHLIQLDHECCDQFTSIFTSTGPTDYKERKETAVDGKKMASPSPRKKKKKIENQAGVNNLTEKKWKTMDYLFSFCQFIVSLVHKVVSISRPVGIFSNVSPLLISFRWVLLEGRNSQPKYPDCKVQIPLYFSKQLNQQCLNKSTMQGTSGNNCRNLTDVGTVFKWRGVATI